VLTVRPDERATAFLEGRVLGPSGLPVAGCSFVLRDDQRRGFAGINVPGTRLSASDGNFRVGPLPPRHYVLEVVPGTDALPSFELPSVELLPNQLLNLGDIYTPPSAQLVVRLRQDGSPVSEALLSLRTGYEQKAIFHSNLDGCVDRHITPGHYVLDISGQRFPMRQIPLHLIAGQAYYLELDLPHAVPFPFHCILPPGESFGEVCVRSHDGTIEFFETLALAEPWSRRWSPYLTAGWHAAELVGSTGRRFVSVFHVPLEAAARPSSSPIHQLQWTLQR